MRIAPEAEQIKTEVNDKVVFFDCGQNFERILCPSCHAAISMEWWQERMGDDCDQHGFRLAKYPTPCCGTACTLHDLVYEWPQGFGRFALDVMNPGIGRLNEAQQRELEKILGAPLRIIYQHF